MDSEKLTEIIYKKTIESIEGDYRELYSNPEWKNNNDDYSKAIVNFYNGLSNEQKNQFFTIVKQITVDQLATLFAILEGTADSGLNREFVIKDNQGNTYQDLCVNFLAEDDIKNDAT